MNKMPVISKASVNETLQSFADNLEKMNHESVEKSLKKLRIVKDLNIVEFIKQYEKIQLLYNKELSYYGDKDNIYLKKELVI